MRIEPARVSRGDQSWKPVTGLVCGRRSADHWYRRLCAASIISALLIAAPVSAKKVEDIGPEPTLAELSALAEAYLKPRLLAPESAKFSWPFAVSRHRERVLFRVDSGWITCGYLRGINAMGGSSGEFAIKVLMKHGELVDVAIDRPSTGFPVIRYECNQLISAGKIRPISQ